MNQQTSFAQSEYARKKKTTRREKFLAQMEAVVPWGRLVALIEPHYPSGKRGRPPVGIERMLRLYFLAQWYALADEALEDAIYDSQALRNFAGIDLGSEAVPDATTLLHFRHLLEAHGLTRRKSCSCAKARSSTRASLPRRVRPRTCGASATRRCTRPRRATNGILG